MIRIIQTSEEYEWAKSQLRQMFNTDACLVDMNEAHHLMKAMDKYEAKCTNANCIKSTSEQNNRKK